MWLKETHHDKSDGLKINGNNYIVKWNDGI